MPVALDTTPILEEECDITIYGMCVIVPRHVKMFLAQGKQSILHSYNINCSLCSSQLSTHSLLTSCDCNYDRDVYNIILKLLQVESQTTVIGVIA